MRMREFTSRWDKYILRHWREPVTQAYLLIIGVAAGVLVLAIATGILWYNYMSGLQQRIDQVRDRLSLFVQVESVADVIDDYTNEEHVPASAALLDPYYQRWMKRIGEMDHAFSILRTGGLYRGLPVSSRCTVIKPASEMGSSAVESIHALTAILGRISETGSEFMRLQKEYVSNLRDDEHDARVINSIRAEYIDEVAVLKEELSACQLEMQNELFALRGKRAFSWNVELYASLLLRGLLLLGVILFGRMILRHINHALSEREINRLRIQDHERYLQTMINTVQSGLVVIDASTYELIDVNPAACRMIGLEREKLLGLRCTDVMCAEAVGNCPLKDSDREVNKPRVLQRYDGVSIPIVKSATRTELAGRDVFIETFIDHSEVEQTIARMRDVNDLLAKQAQEMRQHRAESLMMAERSRQAQIESERSSQSLEQVVAQANQMALIAEESGVTVSRLVLNSMRYMRGSINVLQSLLDLTIDESAVEQSESAHLLLEGHGRLLDSFTSSLIRFVLHREPCPGQNAKPVSLQNLLADVEHAAAQWGTSAVSVTMKLDPDAPESVAADGDNMTASLVLFVIMLVRQMATGTVDFVLHADSTRTARSGRKFQLDVALPTSEHDVEYWSNVQSMLSQKQSLKLLDADGVGLALVIMQQVLTDGTLKMELKERPDSRIGFVLTWFDMCGEDVLPAAAALAKASVESMPPVWGMTGRVLLVGDAMMDGGLLSVMLDEGDVDLQCARTLAAALESIVMHPPALIVVDVDHDIPDIDKIELLSWLRRDAKTRAIPILLLVPTYMEEPLMAPEEMAGYTVLTKPFSKQSLLQAIYQSMQSVDEHHDSRMA